MVSNPCWIYLSVAWQIKKTFFYLTVITSQNHPNEPTSPMDIINFSPCHSLVWFAKSGWIGEDFPNHNNNKEKAKESRTTLSNKLLWSLTSNSLISESQKALENTEVTVPSRITCFCPWINRKAHVCLLLGDIMATKYLCGHPAWFSP